MLWLLAVLAVAFILLYINDDVLLAQLLPTIQLPLCLFVWFSCHVSFTYNRVFNDSPVRIIRFWTFCSKFEENKKIERHFQACFGSIAYDSSHLCTYRSQLFIYKAFNFVYWNSELSKHSNVILWRSSKIQYNNM